MDHATLTAKELHSRAEACWLQRQVPDAPTRSNADNLQLIHDLEVHQIELELQGAELERTRAEMEVALAKITDLFDFAPVGYMTLDPNAGISEANLAAASLLGFERPQLANRSFRSFVAAKDLPVFAGFLQRVFTGNGREHCEVALVVDGRAECEVEMEAVASESGRNCKLALSDVTERKRAAEDRLILSKLESTGILAGGIAHDFNNLLTSLVLNLDLAQTLGPPDGEIARCLEEVKKTAFMARSLTQQLLTFSKGGAPILKITPLKEVIRESVRPALSGSSVGCDFALAEDLWPVKADPGQISQVLRNLVMNAREALPEGGVVGIRAENVVRRSPGMPALPPGGYVRVSVIDHGVGIPPENLPLVFDPYFSTKQRGTCKGMGLGLTICHTIIKKHGGAMAVRSTPGQGSTFEIYLPAATAAVAVDPAAPPTASLTRRRILVMDDEEKLLTVFAKTLRKLGHEVEMVENGQSAIAAFTAAGAAQRPFDLVFLDLTIRNGLGGREVIQALRQINPAVKAIVMSGYADDPAVENHRRYGFDAAMVKPFDLGRIQEVLKAMTGPVSGPA
jgi:PAS domain S-box-containing protein